jgi:hypothetical protein
MLSALFPYPPETENRPGSAPTPAQNSNTQQAISPATANPFFFLIVPFPQIVLFFLKLH